MNENCPQGKVSALIDKARECASQAELWNAEHFLRKALAQAEAGSDEAREARSLLALVRSLGGDLQGALEQCDALEGDDGAVLRRTILVEWGDPRAAALVEAPDRVSDASALFVEAWLDFEAGDVGRCRSRALQLARHESSDVSARGHVLLSRLALAGGGVRQAVDLGSHAVRLADPRIGRSARIAARFAQSYAEEALGRPNRARRAMEAGLGLARRANDRPAQVRAHLRLAELAASEHDSAAAMGHAEGALSMLPPRAPTPLRAEAFLRAAIAQRELADSAASGLGWADDRGAAANAHALREQAMAEVERLEPDPIGPLALLRAELALAWNEPELALALVAAWSDSSLAGADVALDQPAAGSRSALALPLARLAVRLRRGVEALAAVKAAPPALRAGPAGRAVRAIALRQTGRIAEALDVVGGRVDRNVARDGLQLAGFAVERGSPSGRAARRRADRSASGTGASNAARVASGTDALPAAGARGVARERRLSPVRFPDCRRRGERRQGVRALLADRSSAWRRRDAFAEILLLRVRECLLRDLDERVEAERCRRQWLELAREDRARSVALLSRFGLAGEASMRLVLAGGEILLSREEGELLLPGRQVDVLLDVGRRIVVRADGSQESLQSQPRLFEALELVFRRAGTGLSREAFFDALWGLGKQVYDVLVHEPKVIKTLQRLAVILGPGPGGLSVLKFTRESHIGFASDVRAGYVEPASGGEAPLGLRAGRLLAEVEVSPRSPAELAVLAGIDQARVGIELGELMRRGLVERVGHGRGVRYRRAAQGKVRRRAA